MEGAGSEHSRTRDVTFLTNISPHLQELTVTESWTRHPDTARTRSEQRTGDHLITSGRLINDKLELQSSSRDWLSHKLNILMSYITAKCVMVV